MSVDGFGGLVSAVGGALGAAGDLIFGNQDLIPSHTPRQTVGSLVTLGKLGSDDQFFFTEFETPSVLGFGEEQMAAVHKFIGGGKGIDLYGVIPENIEIQGELFNLDGSPPIITQNNLQRERYPAGATAIERLQKLLAIASEGNEIIFQFHRIKFYGAVIKVHADAEHFSDFRFSIQIEVTRTNLHDTLEKDPKGTAQFKVNYHAGLLDNFIDMAAKMDKFLAKATAITYAADLSIQAFKENPSSILLTAIPFIPGSGSAITLYQKATAAKTALGNLSNTIWPQYKQDMLEGQPYETLSNDPIKRYLQPGIMSVRDSAHTVMDFTGNYFTRMQLTGGNSIALQQSQADMANTTVKGRIIAAKASAAYRLMDNIIVPIRTYKRGFNNPDLSRIALEVYGDGSLWHVIAESNNLKTMLNTGYYTLTIPYPDQVTGNIGSLSPVKNNGV